MAQETKHFALLDAQGIILSHGGGSDPMLRPAGEKAWSGVKEAENLKSAIFDVLLEGMPSSNFRYAAGKKNKQYWIVGQILKLDGPPPVAAILVERLYPPLSDLSDREQEILYQLAQGRSPKDIADMSNVSLSTVQTQVDSARAKLGKGNTRLSRSELIVFAANYFNR